MSGRYLAIAAFMLCAACAPKSDLDSAQTEINQLRDENARLKAELAKKSAIPLEVAFRKALMGPGLVAIIETTTKKPVMALAVVKSASLGTTKNFELHIDPALKKELGHAEGAALESGDTITLQNNGYTSLTFTVPAL